MMWSKLVSHIFLDAHSIGTMYLARRRIHFPRAGETWLCVAQLQQEAVFSALPLEGNAQAVPVTQYPWLGGEL